MESGDGVYDCEERMRAGAAFRAEARIHEEHRIKVQLSRRSSAIHAAQIRRAANMAEKLKRPIAPPNYTVEQLHAFIQQAMGTPCPYSGVMLNSKNFNVDHRIPLDRGGEFTLENSEIISESSNKQKGSLTNVEFEMLVGLLKSFPVEAKRDVLKRLGTGGRMFR